MPAPKACSDSCRYAPVQTLLQPSLISCTERTHPCTAPTEHARLTVKRGSWKIFEKQLQVPADWTADRANIRMLCSALRSGSVPIRRKDMQVGAHPHRGSCRQSSFAEPVPRTCWAPQQHCKPVTTLRTPSYVSSRLHTHRWKQGSASTSRMASDSAAQHASEA